MRRQSGFTLVELIVTITIIAVLLALLLPAVQPAREAARRTTCRSNLRQLGIALYTYHDSHRVFPPGLHTTIWPLAERNFDRRDWMYGLLPYIEQNALYSAIEAQQRSADGYPRFAAGTSSPVPLLACPSNPGSPKTLAVGGTDISEGLSRELCAITRLDGS